jgi:hypothetical protein
VDEAVVDHHIGHLQQPVPLERDQTGIPGAGAHEVYFALFGSHEKTFPSLMLRLSNSVANGSSLINSVRSTATSGSLAGRLWGPLFKFDLIGLRLSLPLQSRPAQIEFEQGTPQLLSLSDYSPTVCYVSVLLGSNEMPHPIRFCVRARAAIVRHE